MFSLINISVTDILITAGSSNCQPDSDNRRIYPNDPQMTSEIITVVHPVNHKTSIISKRKNANCLPIWEGHRYSDFSMSNKMHYGGYIGEKTPIASTGKNLFKYTPENDEWDHIAATPGGIERGVIGCEFQDMLLIIFSNGFISPHVSLLKSNQGMDEEVPNISDGIKHFLDEEHIFIENNSVCHQVFCPTPIPKTLNSCEVSSAGKNKVIIVGETQQNEAKAFIGELNRKQNDFQWKDISKNKISRNGHLMFKMGDYVYVMGGETYVNDPANFGLPVCTKLKCCEVYDLKKQRWFHCKYCLPFALSHASVVVEENEEFAVITGGLRDNTNNKFTWKKIGDLSDIVIMFTENMGFKVLDGFKLNKKRWMHVSIRLRIPELT